MVMTVPKKPLMTQTVKRNQFGRTIWVRNYTGSSFNVFPSFIPKVIRLKQMSQPDLKWRISTEIKKTKEIFIFLRILKSGNMNFVLMIMMLFKSLMMAYPS
eukprot:TCONS_00063426-protein